MTCHNLALSSDICPCNLNKITQITERGEDVFHSRDSPIFIDVLSVDSVIRELRCYNFTVDMH